jgi:hypothetical protein
MRLMTWRALSDSPYFRMSTFTSDLTNVGCVPPATVFPCPLQHLQVPGLSGVCTGDRIPRTVVFPRTLQHVQVPGARG